MGNLDALDKLAQILLDNTPISLQGLIDLYCNDNPLKDRVRIADNLLVHLTAFRCWGMLIEDKHSDSSSYIITLSESGIKQIEKVRRSQMSYLKYYFYQAVA
ncbi:MAG: hypothetical protein KJ623_01950 [Nanoarchaeota archaeon]|nr:hypothetical protein [Nanoarchaeota archaeon]MBU0963377.1 hypothetical protein [Nanoarchaeota archaeon]